MAYTPHPYRQQAGWAPEPEKSPGCRQRRNPSRSCAMGGGGFNCLVSWRDGMRCCRSGWHRLCLFCCYQPSVSYRPTELILGFLFHKLSNFAPFFFLICLFISWIFFLFQIPQSSPPPQQLQRYRQLVKKAEQHRNEVIEATEKLHQIDQG